MRKLILSIALAAPAYVANAQPVFPITDLINDPCYKVLVKIAETVEASSSDHNVVQKVTLDASRTERYYTMTFKGLIGNYKIVLENDLNNRCFLLEQKFFNY